MFTVNALAFILAVKVNIGIKWLFVWVGCSGTACSGSCISVGSSNTA
jgi:hypothetical protein